MDGWTDRPSYRDVFLTDASKKANRHNGCFDGWMHKQTIPLIKMGGRKRNSNGSNIYSLEPNLIVAQTVTLPSKYQVMHIHDPNYNPITLFLPFRAPNMIDLNNNIEDCNFLKH